MTVIGLTGPTGAGKSAVMAVWRARGAVCVDADAVYHRLLREDTPLLLALRDRFPAAFQGDMLDRKALGRLVFAQESEKAALEALTHPAVVREIARILRSHQTSVAVVEAIALFGSGADSLCDRTVCVLAPKQDRLARIMARDGIAREYAEMRIASQPENHYYTSRCHYSLHNDGDEDALRKRADELYLHIIGEELHHGGT